MSRQSLKDKKSLKLDGHRNIEDLAHCQFGNWKVLSFNKFIDSGAAIWNCQCKCDKIVEVRASSLRAQESTQCKECAASTLRPHVLNRHIAHAKSRAKKYKYSFNITLQYIEELLKKQQYKCAISGLTLKVAHYYHDNQGTTASLDRIDSNKGYEVDNVQWVHKDINRMKSDFDNQYFIHTCKLIGANNA